MEGSMSEPITGLGFREPYAVTSGDGAEGSTEKEKGSAGAGTGALTERTSLFVTTPNKTYIIPTIAGRISDPRILEETYGSGLGCSVVSQNKRQFIVGREDGIYTYNLDGRGSVFAYEGSKTSIHLHESSVIIVSPPFTPSAGTHSGTIRRAAAAATTSTLAASNGNATESAKVTVFDFEMKYVAWSGVFKDGVREVFSDGEGSIYIVGGDGKVSWFLWAFTQSSC